jgi:hypothetical protein
MSKKSLIRATKHNRVQAVYAKFKRDKEGNITNTPLYNIYGSTNLKRN